MQTLDNFDEDRFRRQVDSALDKIRTILDNTRNPEYPSDVHHRYDDKYTLVEHLTNTAIASQLFCLESLGVNEKSLKRMKRWVSQNRSVTLRLKIEEKCVFDREATRKEESETECVTEYKIPFFGSTSKTKKVVNIITEYFWKFDVEYELFAFKGNKPEKKISLQSRKGHYEIVTRSRDAPKPQASILPSIDLNITYLLQHTDNQFTIDRNHKDCKTPRRNSDIESALEQFRSLYNWCDQVRRYFVDELFVIQKDHGLNLNALNADALFNPVVPLFEDKKKRRGGKQKQLTMEASKEEGKKEADNSLTLARGDVSDFLAEQKRSFNEKFQELSKEFSDTKKLITSAEAQIVVTSLHMMNIAQRYYDGVNYVEFLLRKQLIAAIGREVGSGDFENYMKFHNRKLYREEYQPLPFCFAVRRPKHYPEGTVSIEQRLLQNSAQSGSLPEPISTFIRKITPSFPMSFSINAATKVQIKGDWYLHSHLMHQFGVTASSELQLAARARQFSSFMVLVGRIISPTEFDPIHAIIVRDKDEVVIPLRMELIPSAKEFREAISSLSREQQNFCKMFRSMQLSSTLFGICIIQLKPQLERLLKLPNESLTKEVKLTQDLLELFIKYQIPSDLLSYDDSQDEGKNVSDSVKIEQVKRHVKKMFDMINEKKKTELDERKQQVLYDKYEESDDTASSESEEEEEYYDEDCDAELEELNEIMEEEMSVDKRREVSSKVNAKNKMVAPKQSSKKSNKEEEVAEEEKPDDEQQKREVKKDEKKDEKRDDEKKDEVGDGEAMDVVKEDDIFDLTKVPAELDRRFEALDSDSAVRPTIIHFGDTWTRSRQKSLLTSPATETLYADEQKVEKNMAFDLLDALSRSGALDITNVSMHVVVAATHCFDRSLIDTVIQSNVNPIEKVERSSLIMNSTVHHKNAVELIRDDQKERIGLYSPQLLLTQ